MTKEVEDNKPLEENTKTQKKHETRKRKKNLVLLQKDIKTVQVVCPPLDNEHKYFLSGGVLIDFELLKNNWKGEDKFYNLKGFHRFQQVEFSSAKGFFEVSIENAAPEIQDFSFIIQMLDSLGDQKAHGTAIALKNYLLALQKLERKNRQDNLNSIIGQQGTQDQLEIELNHPALQLCEQQFNDWNFEKSMLKVEEILSRENIRKNAQFYFVVKATEENSAFSRFGISETAMRMVLGQVDQSEITRLLLENGVLFVNPCIDLFLDNKSRQINTFLENANLLQPEFISVKRQIRHVTLNNYVFDLEFTYESYRLSNYKNHMNDFLIVAKLDAIQQQLLMNQLFLQKLNCFMRPTKSLLQDFRYQAQSEYFAEKFYPSKPSKSPSTQPTYTKITSSTTKGSSQSLSSPSTSSP